MLQRSISHDLEDHRLDYNTIIIIIIIIWAHQHHYHPNHHHVIYSDTFTVIL